MRLAVVRGELMAQAAERRPGGTMLAVLGGTPEQARELADDHALVLANDNAPGQLVLAGSQDGVDAARRAARGRGLRALELDVTGAFHSPQMHPARRALAERAQRGHVGCAARARCSAASRPRRSRTRCRSWPPPSSRPCAGARCCSRCARPARERFVDVGPGEVLARLVDRTFKEPPNGVAVAA